MPFLDEIAGRLVSQGVGVIGTNIFTSKSANIPTGNGPYLSVIETGGAGSLRTHNNTAIERATAQILVRAAAYTAARTMLVAAYNALGGANGLYSITLSGTYYLSINARQPPTDLGKDTPGRSMIDFNIEAEKAPS